MPIDLVPPASAPSLRRHDAPDGVFVLLTNEVTAMLSESQLVTTLVVTDLDDARRFYVERLGLRLLEETPAACRFAAGKGSQLTVRRGQPIASGGTLAHFEVDDLEAVIRELVARGVVFEEYETPKTVGFIAQVGPARGAWFKDPAGNLLGLREGPVPQDHVA